MECFWFGAIKNGAVAEDASYPLMHSSLLPGYTARLYFPISLVIMYDQEENKWTLHVPCPIKTFHMYSSISFFLLADLLSQGQPTVSYKGSDSIYTRLGGPSSSCCNYLTLLLYHESSHSHRQYVKNGNGCVPIKLICKSKQWYRFDHGPSLPSPV